MQKKHLRVTKFSKHPLLTQAVDEEHWGLCDGHEEITHCQVHYEIIWQAPQLFITAHTHTKILKSSSILLLLKQIEQFMNNEYYVCFYLYVFLLS